MDGTRKMVEKNGNRVELIDPVRVSREVALRDDEALQKISAIMENAQNAVQTVMENFAKSMNIKGDVECRYREEYMRHFDGQGGETFKATREIDIRRSTY